jgi:hypothetical protein
MAKESQSHFNIACCFQDSDFCKPNTPIIGMYVGNERKVIKMWLDCYLLKNEDTEGMIKLAKSCIPLSGSNSRTVTYVCKGNPICKWRITLKKDSKTGYWSIKNLDNSHINCSHIETNMSAKLISLGMHSKAIIVDGSSASRMHDNATVLLVGLI